MRLSQKKLLAQLVAALEAIAEARMRQARASELIADALAERYPAPQPEPAAKGD